MFDSGTRYLPASWALGLTLLTAFACDWGPSGDVIYVPVAVRVDVIQGADARDTIEARVPIRVQLTVPDDETTEPLRLPVTFSVPGEGCGDPETAVTRSDDDNQAAGAWILGTVPQLCTMEIYVLSPNGTRLGFAYVEATSLPGRPVEGWLEGGQVARDVDTVTVSIAEVPLYDREFNALEWRFEVLEGPAVVLGQELDDDRSRTLVATGVGPGTVQVVSPFGVFLEAGFDVCTAGDQRWIRVFRQEDANTVLGVCP